MKIPKSARNVAFNPSNDSYRSCANSVVRPARRNHAGGRTSIVFGVSALSSKNLDIKAPMPRFALAHGINANIVHRWLHEDERAALLLRAQSFVPVTLDKAPPALTAVNEKSSAPDIRVEVHKGNSTITVNWPLEGAVSCSAWLREWLR